MQACIGSDAENAAVMNFEGHRPDTSNCGYSSQVGCIWLGLYQSVTDQGTAAHWDSWRSGCTSSYRRWQSGEPNDSGGMSEDCAVLGFVGTDTWYDAPCSMRSACLCERDSAVPPLPPALPSRPPPPPPPPSPPSHCPSGWHDGTGIKCYRAVGTGTAESCSAQCGAAGASQLCVHSAAENALVHALFNPTAATCGYATQLGCVWLGLYQTITTGASADHWDAWRGGCSSAYRDWSPGEPNDSGGTSEDCALSGFLGAAGWFDAPCSMLSACVCERQGATSPPPPPPPSPPSPPPPLPLNCPAACTDNPEEFCYYEPRCAQGSLPGCNAGGRGQNCRFCGFSASGAAAYPLCPPSPPSAPPPPSPQPPTPGPPNAGVCVDTCNSVVDGICDDGGSGSAYSNCDACTDCTDCGERLPGSCGGSHLSPSGFRFFNLPLTWLQARTACQAEGGDLAAIHGAAENAEAWALVPAGQSAWIGLTDASEEGVFRWADGSPYEYSHFHRCDLPWSHVISHALSCSLMLSHALECPSMLCHALPCPPMLSDKLS